MNNLIYSATFCLLCGILVYYVQAYEITDYNSFNKYKISKNNILIKLKLFKYDNRFNYFLLIPYLITCCIFIVVLILYVVYLFGVVELLMLIINKYVNLVLYGLAVLLLVYKTIIRKVILNSYSHQKYNFSEDKKNDNDKGGFI